MIAMRCLRHCLTSNGQDLCKTLTRKQHVHFHFHINLSYRLCLRAAGLNVYLVYHGFAVQTLTCKSVISQSAITNS